MPNWCNNEVILEGSLADITEILEKSRGEGEGEEFIMNNLVPMPIALEGTTASAGTEESKTAFVHAIAGDKTYDYQDWYGWRLANWGTKWDFSHAYINEPIVREDGTAIASVSYDTAWSPVTTYWETVGKLYPNVKIDERYFEEGMCFIGQTVIEGGETVEKEEGQITKEDYESAGAVFDEDGSINWEESDYNLFSLFPIV